MNKVIKGRRYDTQTAAHIWETETSVGRSEELFQKRTGEFFLANWTQWEKEESTIEPLSFAEAKSWVSDNCDGDTYEDLFGQVEEGKTSICVSLDNADLAKLKQTAVSRKMSVSELIGEMIKIL